MGRRIPALKEKILSLLSEWIYEKRYKIKGEGGQCLSCLGSQSVGRWRSASVRSWVEFSEQGCWGEVLVTGLGGS